MALLRGPVQRRPPAVSLRIKRCTRFYESPDHSRVALVCGDVQRSPLTVVLRLE